jgi:hypothetical protein
MNFPVWLYHAKKEPKIFRSQVELDEAGEGWVDSPDVVDSNSEEEVLTNDQIRDILREEYSLEESEIKKLKNKAQLLERLEDLKKAEE